MTIHTNTPTGKRRTAYVLGLRDGGSTGDVLPEGSPEAKAAIERVRLKLSRNGHWTKGDSRKKAKARKGEGA